MLLAVPAAILLAWQLPPFLSNASARPADPRRFPVSPPDTVTVRVLTLNSRGGSADPDALLAALRQHAVDVLAIQELTWDLVHRLDEAGLGGLLPHTHLDPRPDAPGAGCGPGGRSPHWSRCPAWRTPRHGPGPNRPPDGRSC